MDWIDPQHGLPAFPPALDFEMMLAASAVDSHQHAFQHFVAAGVDLLMRHIRRTKNEITGGGFPR